LWGHPKTVGRTITGEAVFFLKEFGKALTEAPRHGGEDAENRKSEAGNRNLKR
jgi:hypothetical protein